MRIMGKVAAAVAIGVAGLLGVAPTVSAAPAPVHNGESTGPGGLAPHVSAAPAPINHGDSTGPDGETAGHPWHG
jgi:hypothetical protein